MYFHKKEFESCQGYRWREAHMRKCNSELYKEIRQSQREKGQVNRLMGFKLAFANGNLKNITGITLFRCNQT